MKATAYSSAGKPIYVGGYGFFHFLTERRINADKFCVTIKVGDYKFNAKDKHKLDKLEIYVDIGPRCKPILVNP